MAEGRSMGRKGEHPTYDKRHQKQAAHQGKGSDGARDHTGTAKQGWSNVQCKHVYHTFSKCNTEKLNISCMFRLLSLLIFDIKKHP